MAKKQSWKVKIYTWLSSLLDKANPKQYFKPAMVTPNVIVQDKFLENVATETGLSVYQARAVLSSIRRTAGDYLEAGSAVQLDEDFGTLKPYIKVRGVEKREDCNASCILGVGVKFIPTGKMKSLLEGVQFQFVGTTSDKEGLDDSEVILPGEQQGEQNQQGNQNQGNQNQGEQQGNQNQGTGQVTVLFKSHGGETLKTMQVSVGGSIQQSDLPTPSADYKWNSLASINSQIASAMAGQTVTITEVRADDSF